VENCLDADVDMIIHCVFAEPDGTYRFRPDLVERLVAAGAWVNPTLYVVRAAIDRLTAKREREGLLASAEEGVIERARRAGDVRVLRNVRDVYQAGQRVNRGVR